MTLRNCFRRLVTIGFYVPFLAVAITKFAVTTIGRPPKDDHDHLPEGHRDSLSQEGMVGDVEGTVATVFVNREDAASLLPPELTLVDREQMPDWLGERDDHPLILLVGRNAIGRRKKLLGRFYTILLFPTFLETFVAVPYVKPKGSETSEPCFHFARVFCQKFWPTELGVLCIGWPKRQCPMRCSQTGTTEQYEVEHEIAPGPLFTATTDLDSPVPLTVGDSAPESLQRVIEMLSLPLLLVKGRGLRKIDWNLRFAAAKLRAVSADVTLHPGFFPSVDQKQSFSSPKISDSQFGAFRMETTFLNRGEV